MSRSIFGLPSLIDWLERQEPDRRYRLWRKNTCLLGQYFASFGVVPSGPWYSAWSYGGARLGRFHLLVWVVCGEPQTFGAALERAYELQARTTGERRGEVAAAIARVRRADAPERQAVTAA